MDVYTVQQAGLLWSVPPGDLQAALDQIRAKPQRGDMYAAADVTKAINQLRTDGVATAAHPMIFGVAEL